MATERYDTIINVDYTGQGDIARYVQDLQRLAQVARQAQGALDFTGSGPLALPQGTTPRENGRFVSRQRDIERRQDEFLAALRERITAERAAAQSARQRAFEDRIARIAERPGASMQFGAAGNVEIAFQRHGRNIASGLEAMDRRLAELNTELAAATRGLSAQRVNRQTAYANAAALQNFYEQQARATNATTNVLGGDEIPQLVEKGYAGAYQQDSVYRALVRGGINAQLGRMLPEEAMVALTGGSYEDNRTRGVFRQHGLAPIDIPGYTTNERMRRQMEAAATGPLHDEIEQLERQRADMTRDAIALERTTTSQQQRLAGERAAEVRRQFEVQRRLTNTLVRELEAQQRIVQSRQDLARSKAEEATSQRALTDRPAMTHSDEGGYQIPADRLPPRPPTPAQVRAEEERARRAQAQLEADTRADAEQRSADQQITASKRAQAEAERRLAAQAAAERRDRLPARALAGVGGGAGGIGGGGTGGRSRGGGGWGDDDFGEEFEEAFRNLDGFNERLRTLMDSLRRTSRGASDPVGAAELGVISAEQNIAAVRQRYMLGIGEKGGYPDDEAFEADLTRKVRSLLSAQTRLNNAIEARTRAERAATDAAERAAREGAEFRSAFDQYMRERMRTPLMLTEGTRGPGMESYAQQAGGQRGGYGGAPGGYQIRPEDEALWSRWMQQAGLTPTPPAQSAAERAEAEHARATQRVADAQAAHAATMGATYTDQRQAGHAYTRSLHDLTNAQRAQAEAANRLANMQRVAAAQTAAGGRGGYGGGDGIFGGAMGPGAGAGGGGFGSDFMAGFRGRGDRSYAEQLGQTAKFSMFYGAMYNALFMITQTLQRTVMEGIEFQEAITNLAIAAGRPKDELDRLANELGRSAVEAGAAPSQGVEIGARALGLYGATQADPMEQERVARISAQVVSRLALGSTKTPVELQGDIAAISQSLGMDASGQVRIADLDAFMSKWFGTQQGSTLETVAQSASVGQAAGFNDEELFGIAALMQSRTGQTSSAVAGFMAQIFSRGGEGSLVDVAGRQGIDPNQELRLIIEQLAGLYSDASPREQAEISAAFGRGKIQNAAVALLESFDELQRASNQARTEATGTADVQFRARIDNIGGTLRQLSGEFQNFAQLFGEAGLLDVVGLGIITFTELLQAVNSLLEIWNQLPNTSQQVLIALGLLAASFRTQTGQNMWAGLAARGGAGRIIPAGQGVGAGTVIAGGEARGLRSVAGFAGATRAVGAGLWSMVGPIGVAIGGLLAIGELEQSSTQMREAQSLASDALSTVVDTSDPAAMRAQESALRAAAAENRNATGWFTDLVSFGQADDDNMATARMLGQEAERVAALAARMEANPEARPEAAAFKSFDPEDLSDGLERITDSGGTAATQLAALRDALYGTAGAASAAANAFSADDFAGQHAGNLRAVASRLSGDFAKEFIGELADPGRGGMRWEKWIPVVGTYLDVGRDVLRSDKEEQGDLRRDITERIQGVLTGPTIERRLAAGMEDLGIEREADLDEATAERLAARMGRGAAEKLLEGTGADPEVIAEIQEGINRSFRDYLMAEGRAARELIDPSRRDLTTEEATAMAARLVDVAGADMGALQSTDVRGRIERARQLRNDLRTVQSQTAEPNAYISEQLDLARRELGQAQFDRLESLRRVAMQEARNARDANQIGRSFLNREINAALRSGNAEVLVDIVENAGRGARSIVQKSIEDAREVARAAVRQARAVLEGVVGIGVLLDPAAQYEGVLGFGGDPERVEEIREAQAAADRAAQDLKKYRDLESALSDTPSAGPDQDRYTWRGMDVYNPYKDEEDLAEDRETAAERAAARAEAYASRSQGSIDAARANIMSAQAAIEEAERGSVEYWNAMGQLFDAQNALVEASRAYRNNLRLLNIDLTNPLQEARVATRAAAEKLREDLEAGMADDVIAQDRIDLRRAQAAEEATKFQQRLQTVQTAEELGRISHSRYINYLENERSRLESIKNRTFQQQDQLNQIDRLLQDAANAMEAQWNLGDINLPTPYQVRRYIEERSGAREARMATTARSTTVQNNTFQINGADTAKVRRIIEDTVGRPTRVRTTQTRRR